MVKIQASPKAIKKGKIPDYTPRQGPCPTGFHIPDLDEMTTLTNLIGSASGNYVRYSNRLFMPGCYYLNRSTGAKNTSYGTHRYWTCTMTSNTVAKAFQIDENNAVKMNDDKPANGFNIRPFKDVAVAPDESGNWTEVSGANKVYWNSSLGLLSIKNGDGWLTIADKNAGATSVYDPAGSITAANAGAYYQFGNCYPFPYSGTPTFYTTTQTVSGYGPGNYYNDEHFVKVSSNNRFTGTNNNIWGGTDERSMTVASCKKVYIGSTQVWSP